MKKHFDKYGQISSYTIVTDKQTNISKGYGFLECENKKTYDRVLGIKTLLINDRLVEINQAIKRSAEVLEDINKKILKKIFVAGLSSENCREDLV